jgi:hypothetical protein
MKALIRFRNQIFKSANSFRNSAASASSGQLVMVCLHGATLGDGPERMDRCSVYFRQSGFDFRTAYMLGSFLVHPDKAYLAL